MNIRAAFVRAGAVMAVSAAALSIPTAMADVPTNPAVRGQLAAILSFCGRIYPAGDEVYSALRKLVLGSDQLQDQSEGSREYRKAFDSVSTALASIPHGQALQTCVAATKDWPQRQPREQDRAPAHDRLDEQRGDEHRGDEH